jgi:hypothetical protein
MVTALAALVAGPVAAAAAMYGQRGANRAAREASAVTGYDTLTGRLEARLEKAETREAAAEARAERLELEVERLRLLVVQLGGTP